MNEVVSPANLIIKFSKRWMNKDKKMEKKIYQFLFQNKIERMVLFSSSFGNPWL